MFTLVSIAAFLFVVVFITIPNISKAYDQGHYDIELPHWPERIRKD